MRNPEADVGAPNQENGTCNNLVAAGSEYLRT
jgi:hypothetical protein